MVASATLSLSTLVYDDARLIEEAADALESQGLSYEEAIEQAVAQVDSLTHEKALSYARAILNLEATADAIKEACKRQSARAAAKVNLALRLRMRMLELLPRDFTAEDTSNKVRFQKNPEGVDDSKLGSLLALKEARPDLVKVVPEAYQLDKVAAKKALKGGEEIEGLKLTETYSVRIS